VNKALRFYKERGRLREKRENQIYKSYKIKEEANNGANKSM
jgi:hypothetical protein